MQKIWWLLKYKQLLQYVNESESNTCEKKNNIKMTLVMVEARKSDIQKHESDSHENKYA